MHLATVSASRFPGGAIPAALDEAVRSATPETAEDVVTRLLDGVAAAGERAMRSLVQGVTDVLPAELLPLFSAAEVERILTGARSLDVDLLRRNTEFSGDMRADSPQIKWLWEILSEATPQEQEDFVLFVMARSRVPRGSSDFLAPLEITHVDSANPDGMPMFSQTCFHRLKLPFYSSKEAMLRMFRMCIAVKTMDIM